MKNSRLNLNLKTLLAVLLLAGTFVFTPQQADAQFFNKLKAHAEKKIKQEAEKRAEKRVDNKIDKTFDAAENAIDGKKSGEKNTNQIKQAGDNNPSFQEQNLVNKLNGEQKQQKIQPEVVWSQFDFIPGDQVVFEDGPAADEENGEFPSKWDLVDGNAEIADVDGAKVVIFPYGGAIVPFLKNAKEDYLPEVFTVEFDAYFQPENPHRIFFSFYDDKNQTSVGERIYIYSNSISYDESSAKYSKSLPKNEWRHFSIAVTKDKLKVYLNDERLINVPHMGFNPTGITFEMDGYAADKVHQYAKNIRIAKGGVKYYSRVLSEGKIIVNGIKFDVNKATLRPESMGPINEIAGLMQSNPDLNFSIEGHTDSDGDAEFNQSLSEARAKSVMEQLLTMHIDASRLKSAGWGESKPLDTNGTAEGKANNRRVEFVKFNGGAVAANTTGSNSVFDELNSKTIGKKLEEAPEVFSIPISNPNGIVNGKGTIILYATSDGNLGKMEILDVDKYDNYKLTIKYVTYNYDGSVHSSSNRLEVEGTYNCDLDKGNSRDMIRSEIDFQLGRQDETTTSLYQGEISMLRKYSN